MHPNNDTPAARGERALLLEGVKTAPANRVTAVIISMILSESYLMKNVLVILRDVKDPEYRRAAFVAAIQIQLYQSMGGMSAANRILTEMLIEEGLEHVDWPAVETVANAWNENANSLDNHPF